MPIEPGKPDENNFEITVVSEQFLHVDLHTRMRIVYDCIVNELYQQVDPIQCGFSIPPPLLTTEQKELLLQDKEEKEEEDKERNSPNRPGSRGRATKKNRRKSMSKSKSPTKKGATPKTKDELRLEKLNRNRIVLPYSKRKHISTIGLHVSNDLPQFQFLHPTHPIEFTIITKTPSQWNPSRYDPSLSERFGRGHLLPGVLGLDSHTVAGKDDMKMLDRKPPPGK